MKKRLWAIIVCLCMLLSLVPMQVYAFLGPIITAPGEGKAIAAGKAVLDENYSNFLDRIEFLTLSNSSITVSVPSGRDHTGKPLENLDKTWLSGTGISVGILPTQMLMEASPDDANARQNAVATLSYDLYSSNWQYFKLYEGDTCQNPSKAKDLEITWLSASHQTDEQDRPYIRMEVKFNDPRVTATVEYRLERANHGLQEGVLTEREIKKQYGEPGRHWGLYTTTTFHLNQGYYDQHPELFAQQLVPIEVFSSVPVLAGHLKYTGAYPTPRLETVKETWEYYRFSRYEISSIPMPGEMGLSDTFHRTEGNRTWTDRHHTEIYIDSYTANNFFTAMSSFYNHQEGGGYQDPAGVEGYSGAVHFPDAFAYNGFRLHTYNRGDHLYLIDAGGSQSTVNGFVGFRDIYQVEDEQKPTDPDKIIVDPKASVVGIFPSGSGFRALGAQTEQELLAMNSAAPVAIIRGNSKRTSDGGFRFTSGAAMLSPTVLAVWEQSDSGQYLEITGDGQVKQHGVHLNAPSFKFYEPMPGAEADLKMHFDSAGLQLEMTPEKNRAIFAVNIPKVTVQVEGGTADKEGNLIFKGGMSFATLFDGAGFSMEKLGYGLKNSRFSINGIHAKANIDTASLVGLDLAAISGEINTFEGEELYDFSLELNAFDLFSTQASLTLKRHEKSGQLLPDALFFGIDTGTVGIPLIPPAPVAQITGGGAGFTGLADTCNGDYLAIPPLVLCGEMYGTYLNTVSGTGRLEFGPGRFMVEGSGLDFVGMPPNCDVLDSYGFGLDLYGEKRNYNQTEYTGLNLSGFKILNAFFPNKQTDIIAVNTSIRLGGFGGINLPEKDKLFLHVYGNGLARAGVKFPSEIPCSLFKNLQDKEILGALLNLTAGVQTEIPIRNTDVKDAVVDSLKGIDMYIGACATGTLIGSEARVWVLMPDAIEPEWDKNWGVDFALFSTLDEMEWTPILENRSRRMLRLASVPYAAAAPKKITVSGIPEENGGYLQLAFSPDVTAEQLKSELKIRKSDGSALPLVWMDAEGAEVSEAANAMYFTANRKEDARQNMVVLVYVGQGSAAQDTYTVEAGALPFELKTKQASPFEQLALQFGSNQVSGQVKFPREGKQYRLRTYLSEKQGGTDYVLDERILSDPTAIALTLPARGSAVPTGSYYVTCCLMEERTADFDKNQAGMEKHGLR